MTPVAACRFFKGIDHFGDPMLHERFTAAGSESDEGLRMIEANSLRAKIMVPPGIKSIPQVKNQGFFSFEELDAWVQALMDEVRADKGNKTIDSKSTSIKLDYICELMSAYSALRAERREILGYDEIKRDLEEANKRGAAKIIKPAVPVPVNG